MDSTAYRRTELALNRIAFCFLNGICRLSMGSTALLGLLIAIALLRLRLIAIALLRLLLIAITLLRLLLITVALPGLLLIAIALLRLLQGYGYQQ